MKKYILVPINTTTTRIIILGKKNKQETQTPEKKTTHKFTLNTNH